MKVRRPFADLVQPAQELLQFFRDAGVVCELGGDLRKYRTKFNAEQAICAVVKASMK